VAGIVFEPQTFPRDFVKNRNSSQEHEDDVLKVGEALPEMAEMLEGLDALVEEVTGQYTTPFPSFLVCFLHH
jgi:hypothetical protein